MSGLGLAWVWQSVRALAVTGRHLFQPRTTEGSGVTAADKARTLIIHV